MKRICSKCKLPITKGHRWHFVHRKFLFWTFTKTEHRDCARPTEIHKHVIRLKGEVPLPFDEPGPRISTWGDKIPTMEETRRGPA